MCIVLCECVLDLIRIGWFRCHVADGIDHCVLYLVNNMATYCSNTV